MAERHGSRKSGLPPTARPGPARRAVRRSASIADAQPDLFE